MPERSSWARRSRVRTRRALPPNSGMDPRVYAFAALRLRPGMTKREGRDRTPIAVACEWPKPSHFVILGLDPRIHTGTLIVGEAVESTDPPRTAAKFRHGSQGLRLRCASAPPRDDDERCISFLGSVRPALLLVPPRRGRNCRCDRLVEKGRRVPRIGWRAGPGEHSVREDSEIIRDDLHERCAAALECRAGA